MRDDERCTRTKDAPGREMRQDGRCAGMTAGETESRRGVAYCWGGHHPHQFWCPQCVQFSGAATSPTVWQLVQVKLS